MLRENLSEIATVIAFLIILVLFLNPFGFWMPEPLTYMMIVAVVVVFALFAGLVLKNSTRDEREAAHQMKAGRIGYLSGVGVLVLAIAIEGVVLKEVDSWLVIALAVMVLARICTAWYVASRG
jgi:hypothetical protein